MPQNLLDRPSFFKPQPQAAEQPLQEQAMALLMSNKGAQLTTGLKTEVNTTTPAQREFADKLEQFAIKNFGAIDDNADKFLSRAEVKLYAQRNDITAEQKQFASFIANNYEDLNKLTDHGVYLRWNNLNPKSKPELTLGDFAMLRTASDAHSRGVAIQTKQAEGSVFDYVENGIYGALGGTLFTSGFAKLLGPKVGGPLVLAGAITGGLLAAGATSYFRGSYYVPGCQNYYDQKSNLSKQILDRMPK